MNEETKNEKFQFDLEEDGSLSLESAVFQALGAASTCWESLSGTGVFDSTRATEIGHALLEMIRTYPGPRLGLATTKELLDEIAERIESDYYMGGGGLNYTTVKGRPNE